MLGSLVLAVLAFSFSGALSAGVFHLSGPPSGTTALISLTGIPFSLLCAALCARPWLRVPIAAVLQVGVWIAAYHTTDTLFNVTHTDSNWPLLVSGVGGALGVALAIDAAQWSKPAPRVLVEVAIAGLVGGGAFAVGGYAAGFIVWQGLVGTLLYARIQQKRATV